MGYKRALVMNDEPLYASVDQALRKAYSLPEGVLAQCNLNAPGVQNKSSNAMSSMDWVAQNGLVLASLRELTQIDQYVLRAYFSSPDVNDGQSAGARVELGFWVMHNYEPLMDRKFLVQHVVRYWSNSSKKSAGTVSEWSERLGQPHSTLLCQRKRVITQLNDLLDGARSRARVVFQARGWVAR